MARTAGENVLTPAGEFLHDPVMTRSHKQQAAPHQRAASVVACAARELIGSVPSAGNASIPRASWKGWRTGEKGSDAFPAGALSHDVQPNADSSLSGYRNVPPRLLRSRPRPSELSLGVSGYATPYRSAAGVWEFRRPSPKYPCSCSP